MYPQKYPHMRQALRRRVRRSDRSTSADLGASSLAQIADEAPMTFGLYGFRSYRPIDETERNDAGSVSLRRPSTKTGILASWTREPLACPSATGAAPGSSQPRPDAGDRPRGHCGHAWVDGSWPSRGGNERPRHAGDRPCPYGPSRHRLGRHGRHGHGRHAVLPEG